METSAIEMFKSTVQYENEYIWLKPVCDFFKINYENQTRKIKSDKILANHSTKKSSSLMFGDNYPRILVDKIGFIRWIQLINAKTIDENLQEKFSKYQEMVFDYLYGSLQEEKETKLHYQRLRKLERLYGKIGAEIKREKQVLAGYLDNRYQMKLNFNGQQALS
jgi:hypothetical protein